MDRRSFFRMLGGAAAAAATNPVHFLAPAQGWMRTAGGLSIPSGYSLYMLPGYEAALSELVLANYYINVPRIAGFLSRLSDDYAE